MAASPTGRNPKLLWTAAYQDVLNQMKADYDANPSSPATYGGRLYKQIKAVADSGTAYEDFGTYATVIYQATGDTAYAAKALTAVNRTNNSLGTGYGHPNVGWFGTAATSLDTGMGRNWGRTYGLALILMYDWLWPYLDSSGNRATWLSQLNAMQNILATQDAIQMRPTDSDQTVCCYFQLLCYYYACKDDSATPATLWADAYSGGTTSSSGADMVNRRNALNYYCTVTGAGGEWLESSEYNNETVHYVTLGWSALQTTPVAGDFADVQTFLKAFARRMAHQSTPDYLQFMQWGDEEHPRYYRPGHDLQVIQLLLGALQDSDVERQELLRFALNLEATYPLSGVDTGGAPTGPWAYGCIGCNPAGTALASLTSVAKGWYAAGGGAMTWHTGWTAAQDSAFWAMFSPYTYAIDHGLMHWGDYQLYRKGAWVLTHPIAYSASLGNDCVGRAYAADVVNCARVEGIGRFVDSDKGSSNYANGVTQVHGGQDQGCLPPSPSFNKTLAQKFGSDYAYLCGTQGGGVHQTSGLGYFNPPPLYCHEHTRSLIYLPSADLTSDAVVVVDRISADDPSTWGSYPNIGGGGYRAFESAAIDANPRWDSFLHMPVNPTIAGATVSWAVGSQSVKSDWLLPDVSAITITAQDETLLANYDIGASEKKWRVKRSPLANQQWNVLIEVVSARDSGKAVTSTLLTGSNSSYGVQVARTGNDDRIVVVNGVQAPTLPNFPTQLQLNALATAHLRSQGLSIGWTQTTATAKVICCDLNPANGWIVSRGGARTKPVTQAANPVGEITRSRGSARTG